jgi:hypothetical protein
MFMGISLKKIILEYITESVRAENLYKSWAQKKSGDEKLAMELMSDFFNYQQRLKKKDIKDYSSVKELVSVLDSIKQRDVTKSHKIDVDKIYDDGKLTVVMAKNWETSCKYGANTKWCTSGKDTSTHWDRHNSNGTEFIFINKFLDDSDRLHKLSLYIRFNYGMIDWCDSQNNCSSQNPYDKTPLNKEYSSETINKIIEKCEKINSDRFEEMKVIKKANIESLISNFEETFESIWNRFIFTYDGFSDDIYYIQDDLSFYIEDLCIVNGVDFDEFMDYLSEVVRLDPVEIIYDELETLGTGYYIEILNSEKDKIKQDIINWLGSGYRVDGDVMDSLRWSIEETMEETLLNHRMYLIDGLISDMDLEGYMEEYIEQL